MNNLKHKLKIKGEYYGVKDSLSKFKATRYFPTGQILPENEEYYRVGDVVEVLMYGYDTGVCTYLILDDTLMQDINYLGSSSYLLTSEQLETSRTTFIIGKSRYHTLSNLQDVGVEIDYKEAYDMLCRSLTKNQKIEVEDEQNS